MSTPAGPALSDALRESLRQKLLKKGQEVANKLAKVLAGLDVRLEQIPAHGLGKPGMRPEEKLRAYLDLINTKRRALEANDGSYGVCSFCNKPFSETELDQVPWVDEHAQCLAHAR
jgi:hypothetical protein